MANNKNAFRLELYRQSWEQSRHNETLRGSYAAWVALIIVGALTFSVDDPDRLHWLALILAVLSFSAFMVSLRTWMTTRRWLVTQTRVQSDLKISEDVALRPTFEWKPGPLIGKLTDSLVRFDLTYIWLNFVGVVLFVAMHRMDFSFSEGFRAVWWQDYAIVGGVVGFMGMLWFSMWHLVKFYERSDGV